MEVLKTIADMRAWSDAKRREGLRIGFVPTMGALHEGHLTLVDVARHRSDVVVASIFVNPTQFAPTEDLDRYPRDPEGDAAKLRNRRVDALFLPNSDEMYPSGFNTVVQVEEITGMLEGWTRPTHFAGVTLVVAKLFNIVCPHIAVFGRKDAQQALVIRRMTADLDFGIDIIVAPTVREEDGLAMSSRNQFLTPEERKAATSLSRALRNGYQAYLAGERTASALVQGMIQVLRSEPTIRTDYLAIVSMGNLEPVDFVGPGTLVAAAVYLGKTRLIDNWWVEEDGRAEF